MSRKIWVGENPTHCQLCENPLDETMIDGRITFGDRSSWANVCQTCHQKYGHGLGTGKGQKYQWNEIEKVWIKVEG